MVRRENSTDRHSEILWVHPTQRGAVLDVWKGLDPQHLKKRTKLVDVRSTLGGKGDSWQQVSPKYNHVRPKWVQGSKSCGRLFRDLHQNFGILFFKSGKNG